MNPQKPDEPAPDHSATIRHRWPQPAPQEAPPYGQQQAPPSGPHPHHYGPHPQYGQPPQGTGPHQGGQQYGQQYGAQPPSGPPQTRRLDYTPDMLPPVPDYVQVKPPKSAWWWVIVVGGIALVMAIIAVAVILTVRASAAPSTQAAQSQSQGAPTVTDTASKVAYDLPPGWQQHTNDLVKPFTSQIAPKAKPAKNEGAVVVAFPHGPKVTEQPTAEQLQAQAKSVAFRNAEFFVPEAGSREALSTRSLEIGGRPAATVSFRIVFKDATRSPAYVRTVLIFAADDAISYVFGMTSPDGPGDRGPVDQVMNSVRPA